MFDGDDGLPGIGPYFSLSTITEDKAGRIWVATNNGIAWADPAALPTNILPPPVAISAVRVGDRRFPAENGLTLPKGVSRLEIDYAGLSLTSPKRVRFRYRLSGVDTDWIDAGTRRQAFYTNLAPGEYRFQVIAANNDGVWNRTGATLTFSIPPTFFQSRLFFALCVLTVLALLWGLYALRIRQVATQVRRQANARATERERIARELHDTFLQSVQGLLLLFQSVANLIPRGAPHTA